MLSENKYASIAEARRRLNIKILGGVIAIFAAMHLFLNIYIVFAPLMLSPGELEKLMRTLSRLFGPIAIQQDRNGIILAVKLTVSALFLTGGIGITMFKKWARGLVICLLALRALYGTVVCVVLGILHPHLAIIVGAGSFLSYYFTRPGINKLFR